MNSLGKLKMLGAIGNRKLEYKLEKLTDISENTFIDVCGGDNHILALDKQRNLFSIGSNNQG